MAASEPSEGGTSSRQRAPIGRARALLFGLITTVLVLGVVEIGLRAAGVEGAKDRTTTWFPDHILNPPLVHISNSGGPENAIVGAGQSHHFHPFSPSRAENTFRIAVFGGSAAHGYGVLEPGAFPHRLEQLLQEALLDIEVQVINFGTVAWSSQQLLWANRQLWDLGTWDLLVIYSGHNELLELSSWKTYMKPGEHRRYTRTLLWNQRLEALRLFQVGRRILARDPDQQALERAAMPAVAGTGEGDENLQIGRDPVSAIPAQSLDSLKAVPAEERARIGSLEHRYAARTYTHNVAKIVAMAREHATPVFLINPAPSDFHDPISFPYEGSEGERVRALLAEGEQLMNSSDWEGMEQRARAVLDDHDDAAAMYLLAQSLQYRNRMQEAQEWYVKARSFTEYPNRVVPEVSRAILDFQGQDGVLGVLDAEALFRTRHPDGFIEYQLIYDHCHPSVEGNYVLAGAVARQLLDSGLKKLASAGAVEIDSWVDRGRNAIAARRTPDPRLWEWDGRDYSGENPVYIADFQGDWQIIRERQERAVGGAARQDRGQGDDDDSGRGDDDDSSQSPASAMDWLWAGNGRFYDYQVDAALQAWEKAEALDPSLCLVYANRAHALRLVARRGASLVAARAALTCDPDNSEFVAAAALLERLLEAEAQ
jgi:tetratricopeptide (TPR) repeat protein